MKIAFICGSIEFGRDGVGDYIRRLAIELKHQGHDCEVIAVNDIFISSETITIEETEDTTLKISRIPSALPVQKRFDTAKKWIDEFNPEWLSLQFVIFGHHPKGLPFYLTRFLVETGKNRKWHIMFHELWVGMDKEAKLKFTILGLLQRQIIKKMLYGLKPSLIHTQTKLYQHEIRKLGYNAKYLPLISNIPDNKEVQSSHLITSGPGKLNFIVFANIHYGAPIDQFAKETSKYGKEHNLDITLVFIGRSGKERAVWAKAWRDENMHVLELGEQEPRVISAVLQSCSLGITSTPVFLAEKSGAVAAMLAHGLDVLCVSRNWTPKGFSLGELPLGIIHYKQGNLKEILKQDNLSSDNSVALIANEFINTLKN